MDDKSKNTFVTQSGFIVEFDPVSMTALSLADQGILREFRFGGKPVDPPKYYIEVVGGDKTEYEMTEENIVVDGNEEETEKRRALWKAHTDALEEVQLERQRVQKLLLYDAIKNIVLPEDTSWIERQRRRYIEVPVGDEDALRVHYIETEVLKSASDVVGLTTAIMELSTTGLLTEENLAEARESFRSQVSKSIKKRGASVEGSGPGDGKDKRDVG